MTQFVDSHAHLDGSEFDADREAVIERARSAGLRYLLLIGGASGPDQMGAALDIAETHDWIYAAAGIHPHEASKAQDGHFELVGRLARQPKFLAVGEIGLDYCYDHSPREVQKKVLIRQLDLAREVKLPIIIHCRDAWPDVREIIRTHWRDTGLGGILHCFSGALEDALELMDWGFLVSFAGNLTFKKAENLRAVAREIPLDRLLTETDCPYLAPVPHRGNRNEPAYVVEVTRELARLHNLSEEEMGQRAVRNFTEFFRLAPLSPSSSANGVKYR
jgi:TatD DNase family protein